MRSGNGVLPLVPMDGEFQGRRYYLAPKPCNYPPGRYGHYDRHPWRRGCIYEAAGFGYVAGM